MVHTRSPSRRPPDPLTAGLLPQRSPPRLLTGAACGGLGSRLHGEPGGPNLHHWHSTVRAGDLLHRHSPFRTHRRTAVTCACASPRSSRKVARTGHRRAQLLRAPQGPAAVDYDIRSLRPGICSAAAAPAVRRPGGGTKANTPPETCARGIRSCYLSCMISPNRGDFPRMRVQVPLGHPRIANAGQRR